MYEIEQAAAGFGSVLGFGALPPGLPVGADGTEIINGLRWVATAARGPVEIVVGVTAYQTTSTTDSGQTEFATLASLPTGTLLNWVYQKRDAGYAVAIKFAVGSIQIVMTKNAQTLYNNVAPAAGGTYAILDAPQDLVSRAVGSAGSAPPTGTTTGGPEVPWTLPIPAIPIHATSTIDLSPTARNILIGVAVAAAAAVLFGVLKSGKKMTANKRHRRRWRFGAKEYSPKRFQRMPSFLKAHLDRYYEFGPMLEAARKFDAGITARRIAEQQHTAQRFGLSKEIVPARVRRPKTHTELMEAAARKLMRKVAAGGASPAIIKRKK